jgi:hypothetical protein
MPSGFLEPTLNKNPKTKLKNSGGKEPLLQTILNSKSVRQILSNTSP